MNQKVSVTGLQNIGKLMERNSAAIAKPAEKPTEYAKRQAIVKKTVEAAGFSCGDARFIDAAVREAYNAGHADAFAQSQAVDALLDKQYKARTNLTMPAVVAAVMEQTGMGALLLDLDDVATVFDRCQIDYSVQNNVIEYSLSFKSDTSDRAVEAP